jgi:hypothetical protein
MFDTLGGELTGAEDRQAPLVLVHGLTYDRDQ